MTTSPVVSVTDELISELETELSAYENPTGPVRGLNLHSVRALLAEREELKRDAARYRWLRDQESERGISVVHISGWERAATCWATTFPEPGQLDAAIDAAMQS